MKILKIGRYALMLSVALTLASCNKNENIVKWLTSEQKETYAQNLSGGYPGKYFIIYTNKDCKENEAYEEIISDVQVDVLKYSMSHVLFENFPVSIISKVVDADEELSQALASTPPLTIAARYNFQYDTDYSNIVWNFTPNVLTLELNYNGEVHNISVEFSNGGRYYKDTEEELKQPNAFIHLTCGSLQLQLRAIYDGSKLIQNFSSGKGNEMDILFMSDRNNK